MSYRREAISHDLRYVADTIHLWTGKVGLTQPTQEEDAIRQYAKWRKRFDTQTDLDGKADPDTFKRNLTDKIQQLQQLHQVNDSVFVSNEVPYERISIAPNGSFCGVYFPRLNLELLKKHPTHNFDRSDEEGIEWQSGNLKFILFNERDQQKVITIPENMITRHHPNQIRFLIAAANWALDPSHV